ncbi:hypothetical protein VHEMI07544 [[Torrubiella] hemipterigena]|uniref:Uncharacterized protein n=1 Tax=[Torrubiella] hemipterigena TaxID=1531966 RepID=A0A0A1TLJ1_9HYPO|nr:hypothetical protein VHEMI07544 [[Torrubiella] hemipterigena]
MSLEGGNFPKPNRTCIPSHCGLSASWPNKPVRRRSTDWTGRHRCEPLQSSAPVSSVAAITTSSPRPKSGYRMPIWPDHSHLVIFECFEMALPVIEIRLSNSAPPLKVVQQIRVVASLREVKELGPLAGGRTVAPAPG